MTQLSVLISFTWMLLFGITSIHAQKTKIRTEKSDDNLVVKSYEEVDKVKHGKYFLKFNGVILSEGQYKNGKRHGDWTYFNREKDTIIRAHFKNDSAYGLWKYFKDGQLISEIYYDPGRKVDSAFGYWPDGKIANYYIYFYENDSSFHQQFYPTGKLYQKYYKSSKRLHGVLLRKDTLGNTILKIEYEDGKPMNLDVLKKEAWEQVYFEGNLTKGNGSIKMYFPDTDSPAYWLSTSMHFSEGKLNGQYINYYKGGQIYSSTTFSKGFIIDDVKYYNKQGLLIDTDKFKPEDSVTRWIYISDQLTKSLFYTDTNYFDTDGFNEYMKYFHQRVKYPGLPYLFGIKDRVFVVYKINRLGEVFLSQTLKGKKAFSRSIEKALVNLPNVPPNFYFNLPIQSMHTSPEYFQRRK